MEVRDRRRSRNQRKSNGLRDRHRATPGEPRPPRQNRGQRRIEAVLDAAEAVIAEVGVEAATTNAIAARAGAGMGSLYHFFSNKEAIVAALADRYAARMRPRTEYRAQPELSRVPLSRMVDLIVDPLVEFFRRAPAYWHVFHATHTHGVGSQCDHQMQELVVHHVEGIIGERAPHVPPKRRRVLAMVEVEFVHAMLAFAFASPSKQRPAVIAEIKRLLALHAEMIEKDDDPLVRLR